MIDDDFLWNHYFEEEYKEDDYNKEERLRARYYKLKKSYQDENTKDNLLSN